MAWIKAENAAISRNIDALGALEGDAWSCAHANVTRRLVAVEAAIARHQAALDRRWKDDRDETD
jgi:hypothetical protein